MGCRDAGETEKAVHQIQARDQQRALAQHRDERGLKGLSRSLQKIAAQIIEAEEGTGNDQPGHQLAAESEIVFIFQKQANERIPANETGQSRDKSEAQRQTCRFLQGLPQADPIPGAVVISK